MPKAAASQGPAELRRLLGAWTRQDDPGAAPLAQLLYFDDDEALALLQDDDVLVALLVAAEARGSIALRTARLLASVNDEERASASARPLQVVLLGAWPPLDGLRAAVPAAVEGFAVELHSALDSASAEAAGQMPPALAAALRLGAAATQLPPPVSLRTALVRGRSALQNAVKFHNRFGQRPPAIVVAFGAVMAVFVALAQHWGGTKLSATLVRMGANVPARTLDGDWWRLLTAGWLHIGTEHAIANVYGLLLSAMLLAPALGTSRFVLLYLLSMTSGEALTLLGDPLVVGAGASAGVFGLLGAAVAATWGGVGIVPARTARELSYHFAGFAVLQLLFSLGPNVSLLAHVGGFGGGALLVVSRVVTIGLPRPWRGDPGRPWSRWLMRALALAAVAMSVASFSVALQRGRPWLLMAGATQRIAIGDTGLGVDIPAEATAVIRGEPDGAFETWVFGTAIDAPLIVTIWLRRSASPVEPADHAASIARRHAELVAAAPLEPLRRPPEVVLLDGRRWIYCDQARGRVRLPRWVGFVGAFEVDLQVSIDPDARDAVSDNVERFVRSVSVVAESR